MVLKQDQRAAILELHRLGVSRRQIAKTLQVSRPTVRKVICSASSDIPEIHRQEKAAPYRQEILELYARCKGNRVRVHEELQRLGAKLSYQTLTRFCRANDIGVKRKQPAGEYHFAPGEEIQHDTSPHRVTLAGKKRKAQTASAVMCFSRRLYFQLYPTFNRFYCKLFLTEALQYFGGACLRMMIDNTHVVVLKGTGKSMVPVPEMAAFADRFSFVFEAHEKGHADRSARVENQFWYIENNFLAGRSFDSWQDLNERAVAWCDKVNGTYKKHLQASPQELFAIEKGYLQPLPLYIPEVYLLHHRMADVNGYVRLHTNRYSVPTDWIGRMVEVRQTKEHIQVNLDDRHQVTHTRLAEGERRVVCLPEHRPPWGKSPQRGIALREERTIRQYYPFLVDYAKALKKQGKRKIAPAFRHLIRMAQEYPREPLVSAIAEAAHYGLYDLDRVERMVLRRIANDYFLLNPGGDDER